MPVPDVSDFRAVSFKRRALQGSAAAGHGIGYKYAHDYPGHYVDQQYLPDEIKDARFYEPGDLGYEKKHQRISAEDPRRGR